MINGTCLLVTATGGSPARGTVTTLSTVVSNGSTFHQGSSRNWCRAGNTAPNRLHRNTRPRVLVGSVSIGWSEVVSGLSALPVNNPPTIAMRTVNRMANSW